MTIDPAFKTRIDSLVNDNNVVLFMKGNRRMPQCGFSSRLVGILDGIIDAYHTVDVLSDPDVRSGMKEYSDWPTFPQLYIGGEFQGGCDIITEMAGNGELHGALGVTLEEVDPPEMTLTDSASRELKTALADMPEGEFLRFRIGPGYSYELNLGPRTFADIEVTLAGWTVVMDRGTAKLATGTVIDHVTGPMGSGFKISNPDEPGPVQQIQPNDLKALLDGGDTFQLIDVRSDEEVAVARLAAAKQLTAASEQEVLALDRGTTLVFLCHHGMRSQQAAEHFRGQGFRDVRNVVGGIDAWSQQVDPSVPRY